MFLDDLKQLLRKSRCRRRVLLPFTSLPTNGAASLCAGCRTPCEICSSIAACLSSIARSSASKCLFTRRCFNALSQMEAARRSMLSVRRLSSSTALGDGGATSSVSMSGPRVPGALSGSLSPGSSGSISGSSGNWTSYEIPPRDVPYRVPHTLTMPPSARSGRNILSTFKWCLHRLPFIE